MLKHLPEEHLEPSVLSGDRRRGPAGQRARTDLLWDAGRHRPGDPDRPSRIRQDFHCGDHLHGNDAGYQALADSIDLSLFG
ncbi:hypothetical protein ACWEN6_36635 [Sphaerisporangium sp. NPDC004334]